MFTGIVEALGEVKEVEKSGSNLVFRVYSPISNELKVDQSIAHDGVCLTVESVNNDIHQVTAIEETIKKTNLSQWQVGSVVNLERCMQLNGRLDGHIVQGHVDTTAICDAKIDRSGSWEFTFKFPKEFASLVIEKGSISINGTSLTVFNVTNDQFTVAIIPYTYHHTNIGKVDTGDIVNIEFDMIGKYVNRMISLRN